MKAFNEDEFDYRNYGIDYAEDLPKEYPIEKGWSDKVIMSEEEYKESFGEETKEKKGIFKKIKGVFKG